MTNRNLNAKRFAFWGGLGMFFLGTVALIPGLSLVNETLRPLYIEMSYGYFLGIFPMNILSKMALITFGAAGVMMANAPDDSPKPSIIYSRVVFWAMGILAIAGIIPGLNTLYGYWPLYAGEILVHGSMAVLGAYYGYGVSLKTPSTHQPLAT